MPESDDPACDDPRPHLGDVPDGAGCSEIWEHLSDGRRSSRSDEPQDDE